jgi:hypothetical protein
VLLGELEVLVVDAVHERGVGVRRRGRDDHERGAAVEVGARRLAAVEEAGRLDDDVDAEVAPRQVGGVALAEHLEGVAADLDADLVAVTLSGKRPSTESYLRRCAIVSIEPRSFTATKSMSAPLALAARKKLRPMRPKPLMPTLTVMSVMPPQAGGNVVVQDRL